jgi:hypothetical protein
MKTAKKVVKRVVKKKVKSKKINENNLKKLIMKIYKEEKGKIIDAKNNRPEDVEPKENAYAGGDNLEDPKDWEKVLKLEQKKGGKLSRILKEHIRCMVLKEFGAGGLRGDMGDENFVDEPAPVTTKEPMLEPEVESSPEATRSVTKIIMGKWGTPRFFEVVELYKDKMSPEDQADLMRMISDKIGVGTVEKFARIVPKTKAGMRKE